MFSKIFKNMKDIRDTGGIHMTLDFGKTTKHDVIVIPVIQFIIIDYLICGHTGGN